jgi:hypothetical protein
VWAPWPRWSLNFRGVCGFPISPGMARRWRRKSQLKNGLQRGLPHPGPPLQRQAVEDEITTIVNQSTGRKIRISFGKESVVIDPEQIIEVLDLT